MWTSRGTFNKEFFKLPSDWVEPNAKVRNRHVEPSDCHLNLVMDFLLRDDPQVKVRIVLNVILHVSLAA